MVVAVSRVIILVLPAVIGTIKRSGKKNKKLNMKKRGLLRRSTPLKNYLLLGGRVVDA
jgi:hypothetical protein